jgi:hypothetical protein
MTLAVLGAGFGRTGTLSLQRALHTLGFAPCYHMVEVARRPEHARVWSAAARGERVDWRAFLAGYAAAVDWPATAFWRELASEFPAARIVLTVRDSAAWYESFRATIVERTASLSPPHDSPLRAIYDLTQELVLRGVFGGRAADEQHARTVYEAHNASVIEAVPATRLLVHDLAAGWAPLCAFLDRPVPREPFPHVNTRAGFLREYLGHGARRRRTALKS